MDNYRAPRVWHIEKRFDRYYVVNQFDGFEGWHTSLESAKAAVRLYVLNYGDKSESDES